MVLRHSIVALTSVFGVVGCASAPAKVISNAYQPYVPERGPSIFPPFEPKQETQEDLEAFKADFNAFMAEQEQLINREPEMPQPE